MLSANLEHELRTEFFNVGNRIQAPDGLTERLLREDYRPRGRVRLLVPLLLCSIAALTLGGVLVAINLTGRTPAAASVLASEFSVFNRPDSSSDALPSIWPIAVDEIHPGEKPTASRLLASHPGYGIEEVYAATYPKDVCLFVRKAGGGSGDCIPLDVLEPAHALFLSTSGSSAQPVGFMVGFVASDVTNVRIDGVVAPVSADDFFLAPLADADSGVTMTLILSDGPPITETIGGLPAPRPSDGGANR
jgi:hypothetical protein